MLVSQDTKSPPDQNILLKMSTEKHLQTGDKIHQTGTLFCCSCPIPIPHHKRWVIKVIEGNYEWQWKEALTSVDINIAWQASLIHYYLYHPCTALQIANGPW